MTTLQANANYNYTYPVTGNQPIRLASPGNPYLNPDDFMFLRPFIPRLAPKAAPPPARAKAAPPSFGAGSSPADPGANPNDDAGASEKKTQWGLLILALLTVGAVMYDQKKGKK